MNEDHTAFASHADNQPAVLAGNEPRRSDGPADMEHAMQQAVQQARDVLDEIRMPLHILLDTHFGELNDNQEELLGNAMSASDRMVDVLRALEGLSKLDSGGQVFRADRVRPSDILRSIEPQLRAVAERRPVLLQVELAPDVPSCRCDGAEWRNALVVLFRGQLERAEPNATIRLCLLRQGERGVCTLRGGAGTIEGAQEYYASRLIRENGGETDASDRGLTVTFPP